MVQLGSPFYRLLGLCMTAAVKSAGPFADEVRIESSGELEMRMFTQGGDLYLLIPGGDSDERILHQGVVVELGRDSLVARFAEPIVPEVGSNVFLHCEVNR